MKTCSKCHVEKPLEDFHRHKRCKGGRRGSCKACENKQAHEYRAANREAIRTQRAEYYVANREARTEYQTEYRSGKREPIRDYSTEYNAANPHVRWEFSFRRRTKRFGFEPVMESFTVDELIARWGPDCWHCGGQFESLDHYPIPVSRGGAHTLNNARPSCSDCNRKSWREDFTPTRR